MQANPTTLSVNVTGASTTFSLFSASNTPALTNLAEGSPVELGMKFTSSSAGQITALKFYRSPGDTGPDLLDLWTSTGTNLVSVPFTNTAASGWQTVSLTTPVTIAANTTYIVSYHTTGTFVATGNYFSASVTSGPLTAPSSGNGVYADGGTNTTGIFPNGTYNAGNYFADVVFQVGTPVNLQPVLVTQTSNQNAVVDRAFSLALAANTFTDPNGDALTYTATAGDGSALPSWLTFNATTRTFSGTPATANIGTLGIKVTASDGSLSASETFNVVVATNSVPVLTTPTIDQNAFVGSAFTLALAANTFTDPNGDALTYTATAGDGSALPSWLTFNATTRTFSGTPGTSNVGTLGIKVTATDPGGLSASETFNVAVATPDTTKPTISLISASPSSGALNAGKAVVITLTASEPVVVTGSPSLTLNDGGKATYAGGSGTSALTFTYTVAAGQNTTALTVSSVSIPSGSSIKDLAGNTLTTTLPTSAALGLQIDTKVPTVTSESASAASKALNAGKTAAITLVLSESVVVSGTPTLTLNDGGTATYNAALSSATALTFNYTVLAGQNTTALKIASFGPAGSIQDLAGNALATVPATNLALVVDTVTPTITRVTSSPSTGTVTTATTPTITLRTSEAVTVSGTPQLLLSNGGTALYNPSASTTTSLAFTYTPSSPQTTSSLSVIGLELPSPDAIKDAAGNAAILSGAAVTLGFKVNAGGTGTASSLTIAGTQEAEIFGASSQNVIFADGANGTLKLDTASSYTGSVSGLTSSDTIDLARLAYGPNMTVGYSQTGANNGVLSISNGTQSAAIALLGNYASTFTLSSDGHGGTNVVNPATIAAPLLVNPLQA